MKDFGNILIIILFFFISYGAIFVNSYSFMDSQIVPKWYWVLGGSTVFVFIFAIIKLLNRRKIENNEKSWNIFFFIIYILCFFQALYGFSSYLGLLQDREAILVGSFDNPAGFTACLSGGLPFMIYFLKYKNMRWATVVAICVVFSAILVSESRTGLCSALLILLIVFFKISHFEILKRKWFLGLLICFGIAFGVGCYYIKKDSADGRLLIWKCAFQMIKEKPLMGHGFGSFDAKYMLYQAEYFQCNSNSQFILLADNVKHTFNEYLFVLVEFGIFVLFVGIFLIWKIYRKQKDWISYTGLLVLLSIAFFSFFSYPFMYPFTWIIVILAVSCILRNVSLGRLPEYITRVFWVVMVVVCVRAFVCITDCVKAELYWYKTAIQSFLGRTNEVLVDYDDLEKAMGNNASFLYNWSAELHEIGYYKKSITVLQRCEKLCNNSDIQLLIADSYCQLKDYKQAERHYILASQMCPKLFLPLYELINLYKVIGNEAKAKKIALQILEKPVKVNSPVVDEIKQEMREFLNVFL